MPVALGVDYWLRKRLWGCYFRHAVDFRQYVDIYCTHYNPPVVWSTPHQRQNSMKTIRRKSGFTLVEIMIVVAIIGMLATIAIPNFVRSRGAAQQKACISNLYQINGAVNTWATELNKGPGQAVTYSDIAPYLQNAVVCPGGGTTFEDSYSLTTVDALPTCQRQPQSHKLPPLPGNTQ